MSEANRRTESKDPYPGRVAVDLSGSSHDVREECCVNPVKRA